MSFARGSSLLAAAATVRPPLGRRLMCSVAKGTSRAAVHGSRSPASTTVEGRDKMEEEIEKGKEQKQEARERVEEKVDAQIGGRPSGRDGHKPAK
ncbi:hypothetical protein ACP70R_022911 [Stipagrostis hirtigluma subsp. patula]